MLVYYSKDDNKDNIPDKYQITFTYVSADEEKGTVTGTTSEIVTVQTIQRDEVTGVITAVSEKTPQHPTQPSTVKAEAGYKLTSGQIMQGNHSMMIQHWKQSLTLKIRLSQHILQNELIFIMRSITSMKMPMAL